MKQMICVLCPMGCSLEVSEEEGVLRVEGNGCKRGIDYGRQEYREALRTLTTTVRIEGALYPRLPVVSSAPIPLTQVDQVMEALRRIRCQAPVLEGEIILEDPLGRGVHIVASRGMDPIEEG